MRRGEAPENPPPFFLVALLLSAVAEAATFERNDASVSTGYAAPALVYRAVNETGVTYALGPNSTSVTVTLWLAGTYESLWLVYVNASQTVYVDFNGSDFYLTTRSAKRFSVTVYFSNDNATYYEKLYFDQTGAVVHYPGPVPLNATYPTLAIRVVAEWRGAPPDFALASYSGYPLRVESEDGAFELGFGFEVEA